jgi:hypothetical protein
LSEAFERVSTFSPKTLMNYLLILLTSLVTCQVNLIPQACSRQCATIQLDACKQPLPTQEQEWTAALQLITECVCPKLRRADSCSACLITQAPSASTYFSSLNSFCARDAAAPEIAKLFGKSLMVEVADTPPPSSEVSETVKKRSSASGIAPALSIGVLAAVFMF